jgi:hypothetical protein
VDKTFKINLYCEKYCKNPLQKIMSWYRGHSSLTEDTATPVVDRCINCGNHEQVHTQTTMEYEGSLNSGPICQKRYSTNRGPRITFSLI